MKNKYIITHLFLLMAVSSLFAQNLSLNRAKSEYNQLYYVKTTEILLKVAEKGFKSQELFEKLGNSLYFTNRMEEANKWYKELFELYKETVETEYYYRFAMTYKALQKYDEADYWLLEFNKLTKEELRVKSFEKYLDGAFDFNKIDKDILLYNLPLNTIYSDFGSSVYNNRLYFSTPKVDDKAKKYSWNEQNFLDIFYSDIEKIEPNEIKLSTPVPFYDKVNSKLHDTNLTFFNDNLVFFTRNNYYKNRKFKDGKGTNQLTILMADIADTLNINPTPITISNKKFTIAHPVFNNQKTRMYFSSDMKGYGQSDLFYVSIDSLGAMVGEPVNLGPKINTEGKESFPYVSEDGDLYFSSDGHYGFGGMDIFTVSSFEHDFFINSTQDATVVNVGKPFNSEADDFAFFSINNGRNGFLSSNRKGGVGDDDIYYFSKKCEPTLEVIVVDKQIQEVISNAVVTIYVDGVFKESILSDDQGKVAFYIDCNSKYIFRAEKELYISDEKNLLTSNNSEDYQIKLELNKDVKYFEKGDDISKIMDIKSIYFDFDKHNIRPDAAVELQKVIEFLKANPKLAIDVRSHTDSRGSFEYNLDLSQRRNTSTINYIIEVGGIDKSRITGRGYGESKLLNNCSDGVKCTEEEHQLNRRSEFIIESDDF